MWQPKDHKKFTNAYLAGASDMELTTIFKTTPDKIKKYTKKCHNEFNLPYRNAFVPTNALPIEIDTTDDIDLRILKLLKASPKSFTTETLADELDVSPKKIKEAVLRLSAEKYLVDINETGDVKFSAPKSGKISRHVHEYLTGNKIKFGVVSDTHLCSKYERLDVLNDLYDIFEREGINTVYHCGNTIDGEAPFNKQDLHTHGIGNQVQYFIHNYPTRPNIQTYFLAADDHEGWAVIREGIDIGQYIEDAAKRAGREDLTYLGYLEHDIHIPAKDGFTCVRIFHPGGGSAYATSYVPQKIVESYTGGNKPQVLLISHHHKVGYFFARNVHCVLTGCTENQTPFMRKKRIAAHIGGFIIEMVQGNDGSVLEFTPRLFPFYDTNSSDDSWAYKMYTE